MVLEYRTGKVIGGEGKGAVQDVVVRGRHGGADQQVGGFGEVHMFRRPPVLPWLTWNTGNSHHVSGARSMNLSARSFRKLTP